MKRGSVHLISETALKILKKRYFKKDENGNCVEDWPQMVNRIINAVCINEPDVVKKEIHDLIFSTKFLPNSPCLVNAGNAVGGLSACFVTKAPEDSWTGMMKNIETFGHVARRGGGCGVNFSNIRPEGDPVFGSTHTKACGPIEHMRVVSETMSSITQAGFRGMANMGVLNIEHPDVEKFIKCKQHPAALKSLLKEDIFGMYDQMKGRTHEHANILLDKFMSNFNISILVKDKFLKAVADDKDWNLEFNGKIYKTVKAKELFDLIIESAWANGDPGLLFYEAINNGPYKYSNQILTATNPCGNEMFAAIKLCKFLETPLGQSEAKPRKYTWKVQRLHVNYRRCPFLRKG